MFHDQRLLFRRTVTLQKWNENFLLMDLQVYVYDLIDGWLMFATNIRIIRLSIGNFIMTDDNAGLAIAFIMQEWCIYHIFVFSKHFISNWWIGWLQIQKLKFSAFSFWRAFHQVIGGPLRLVVMSQARSWGFWGSSDKKLDCPHNWRKQKCISPNLTKHNSDLVIFINHP